MPILSNT
jgi:hypothetical protein